MITDIIYNFIYQIIFIIGSIILFGYLIALCNKKFYKNFGNLSLRVCYVTGAIGTPVHECAHALFCIIFRHKIHDIKLFQTNSQDGVLGYVNHSYNPKSKYQTLGNFFIGIAPIIVISTLLYLLSYFLTPNLINLIKGEIINFKNFNNISNIFIILQSFAQTIEFWIFIIISLFLALHMNLSNADIEGAKTGLFLTLASIFIINIIFGLIGGNILLSFTNVMMSIIVSLNTFLILSLVISLIAVLISYIFRFFNRNRK